MLKKFANTATADYMISKEVRFLCVIRSTALTTSFHKCLLLAKKHKLRMGRVLTVSSDILVDPQQSASNGDTLLEIVGLSTAAKIHFYNEVSQIGPSVYIKESGVEALSVLINIIFSHLLHNYNSFFSNSNYFVNVNRLKAHTTVHYAW